PDIVRIENAEKRFGNFRKFVVDFKMDSGGQKGERLHEAFDVRIFALALCGIQLQTAGDLRILGGELRSQLAEVIQLIRVVDQEIVTHRDRPRESDTHRYSAERRCRTKSARARDPSGECLQSENAWSGWWKKDLPPK